MNIKQSSFGYLANGREVFLFSLTNDAGMQVNIINYGAIIAGILVPDRHGTLADVVLGFDNLQPYVEDKNYIGAAIGRYANRIGLACFELDGRLHQLDRNDGKNHLHGGRGGFHKVLWDARTEVQGDSVSVMLSYLSLHGDQGYPGNLAVQIRYQLNQHNELKVSYSATTDRATPVNLTQHSYFNLANDGDILGHQLWINADAYTPINRELLPNARHENVAQTPFDFRTIGAIGARIATKDEQLHFGSGYDHNYVLNKSALNQFELAALVSSPSSGRQLEILTQEPGLQFYSGNFLNGEFTGKGRRFSHRSAFCVEPQHFPDSPNSPTFPSTILQVGEQYSTNTAYRFSVRP